MGVGGDFVSEKILFSKLDPVLVPIGERAAVLLNLDTFAFDHRYPARTRSRSRKRSILLLGVDT